MLSHCVKNIRIRSFSWSVFSRIWTEYRDGFCKSLYSVQTPDIETRKSLVFGYTFHAVYSILLRLLRNTGIQANVYDVTFSQNI